MTTTATVFGRRLGAVLFAALFLSALPGAASEIRIPEKPLPNESPRGAVLAGDEALFLAQHSCRDPDRTPLTAWTPGPAEIARLEKLLPKYMAGLKATPRDYKPLHEYYRQYIGTVRNGKKRICVNLFHYNFVRHSLERPEIMPDVKKTVQKGRRAEDFWKYEPISVMDGGASFFTVQFDVATGTFLYLGVNGMSQGRFSE
ncbi:MAG TPA: hypothetical protein VMW27_18345 [Thermoanaerobaculia bacterium]|nr:hypothetical protein [Thermoanaerobaculia bacterium]